MKRYLEQLKPQERRWVVAIAVVVFVMLNYFFVWPHFHDWSRDSDRMVKANKQIEVYRAELRRKPDYERKLRELQSDGSSVVPEDQAIDFVHFYSSRAISNKVLVLNQGPLVTRTNEFFLEQQMGISVQADETNLVGFLYSLGAGNSMMRVRMMSLHPDPSHMKLTANITLVASYQKKAPVRAAAPIAVVKAVAATPKPPAAVPIATTPAPKPAEHTNKIAGAFARPTAATNKPGSLNR